MTNAYCREGFCDVTNREGKNNDNLIAIGGYVLFVITVVALTLYAAANGVYLDPAYVP